QTQNLANLTSQVSSMAVPDTTPLETGIAGNTAAIAKLQTTLASLSKDLTDLDVRLTTLEKQPISQGVSQAAIDAYERELKNLQTAVADQRGEIESLLSDARAMEQNAELTAQDALARAALTRVLSAIDSGQPFDSALADLVSVTGTAAPEALSAVAARGVSPLIQLQDRFPGAARAALSAARMDDPDAENGVVAFLSRQLGARSVAPREGSDADAVLSRAEASLKEGRLNDTLAEIETLPPTAMPAMSDWVALAEARRAAQAAAEKLAQSLNSK
ncbi:MAG: mitofilin family membrane protein, partial [Paracoccaceae bacterium]